LKEDSILFADAESTLEEAAFHIFGVCYDGTCSHRKGTAKAPGSIREESYNFETFFPEHGIDLNDLKIFDAGDVTTDDEKMVLTYVVERTKEAQQHDQFPIMIGGEHSATLGALKELKDKHPDLFYIHIDAHLDYRDKYEGNPFSHACILRRAVELLGPKMVAGVGVRSYSREEAQQLKTDELLVFTNEDVQYEDHIEHLKKVVKNKPVYISLDMDAIDPAYAPGVGNPEPFGMEPRLVKELLFELKENMVGFDCMEVNPDYDNGNTAALAARLIREVIVLKSL